MSAQAGTGASTHYFSEMFAVLRKPVMQLLRSPSNPRQAEAGRKLRRQIARLTLILGAVVVALMLTADAREILLMPPRGAASLWPVRVVTDFGKAAHVLGTLALMLLAVAVVAPLLRGDRRSRLIEFAMRLQFLLLAVAVPLAAGEAIKWIAGRGRPFVGGQDNVLDFVPFVGTEAHASFPSAHAIAAFALAFGIGALWPRARAAVAVYAVLIGASRLVLLAHHPSDVVAGALIGIAGAMTVRYWFAISGVGFAVGDNGSIVPLAGDAPEHPKGVARGASAP
jgi:undecaprenyl-diphosphatase